MKVDQSLCIGCGYCVEACPYDARYINPRTNKVDKCDFCSARLERGEQPACVNTCTAHAKYFGDLEDPQSFVFGAVYEKHARRLENSNAARPVRMSIIWESPSTSIWCLRHSDRARPACCDRRKSGGEC